MLFFATSIHVFGQELDQEKEDEGSEEWDAILNTIEEGHSNSQNNPADELYKNLWESTNIKYPSTVFAQKGDTMVFTLVSPGESPYCHPYKGKVISKFGPRSGRMHTGTDVKLHNGDTVYCAFDGKVRLARSFSGYGKMVLVRHKNGLETIYGHLKAINVQVNDTIKAGAVIGLGGRTGRATTDHLHFETRIFGDPFDSNKYIDFETFTLRGDYIYYKNKKIAIDLDELKDSKSSGQNQVLADSGNGDTHVVRRGDNLSSIARMYNTTVRSLCALNNITTQTVLRVGATLLVR
jgi:murein DD-endopeptidase MepM/ murein hydrolase activator NlpD